MSSIFSPSNSIWPNGIKDDGENYKIFYTLGTNKISLTSETEWPIGDKLVSPFVYENGKLVGFCDTEAMIVSGNTSVTLPYTHIEANFSSIKEGDLTVNAPNATVKKFKWAITLDGENTIVLGTTFANCTSLDEVFMISRNYKTDYIIDGVWNESLESLVEGNDGHPITPYGLFNNCSNLITFNSDLRSLTNGNGMFYYCENMETFNADISSLEESKQMFYRTLMLKTFSTSLPSLKNGESMFEDSGIRTFNSDLSSLTNGNKMFYYCEELTSFTSNLSSLTNGDWMFTRCKLNSQSVKNIIDTINTVSSGNLRMDIGCNDTAEDADIFAQEIGYADMTSLLSSLQSKGWTVLSQYTGRPSSTYTLRRPSENTLPIFAKLIETEDKVEYTSHDETKKYILDFFHRSTGSTDGYTQFNSLEEAEQHFNIKPIERN